MADDYDLLIVGGGLAGLTAALYGARFGLHTCLVEHMAAGGQVLNVEKIENFPGLPEGIAGFDLGPLVQEQAEAAGAEFVMDTAIGLEIEGERRILHCEGADLAARSIVIATGLSVPGLCVESAAAGAGAPRPGPAGAVVASSPAAPCPQRPFWRFNAPLTGGRVAPTFGDGLAAGDRGYAEGAGPRHTTTEGSPRD